jgi:hypothetical protein
MTTSWRSARWNLVVDCVEAVALGQEVLERARPGLEQLAAARPVRRLEDERPRTVAAGVGELDPLASPLVERPGVEVGQLVRDPRGLDREAAGGVKAEEPDSGPVLGGHIRADVEFREGRDDRQCEGAAEPEPGDQERRDSEPGTAVVLVHRELGRDELAQSRGVDPPVREEEVVPGLPHRPRALRQRPRAVLDLLQPGALACGSSKELERAHGRADTRLRPA